MKTILTIWLVLSLILITINYLFNNTVNSNNIEKKEKINTHNLTEAYFAWGCFWCMEWIFEAQEWVSEAISWYIGWDKSTANYKEVSTWKTKHREWVKIIYDPSIIKYDKLVELFWTQIDPTDSEGQFADKWFHYTTAIYYSNDDEKLILENSKKNLENSWKFDEAIVTKILPASEFFDAEEYHQDYYKKSSIRYNAYKKGSGRKDFIEDNWEDKIKELEKNEIIEEDKISENKNEIIEKDIVVERKIIKDDKKESEKEENKMIWKKIIIEKDIVVERKIVKDDKKDNSWYLDYSKERLKNSSKENIVLFFHADWCSSCRSFEKQVLTEKIPEDILILKVNYDKENELRRKYNIVTQTSFVLVDSDWNLKKRWIWWTWINSIIKKIEDFKKGSWEVSKTYTKEELKARLTPLQYKVTQEGWTEPAFNNKYWNHKEEWIYIDIVDGTALFSSTDKFDSWTGWPSFTKPIDDNFIKEEDDYKLLLKRTEVKTESSHLWHVFEDWPKSEWWLRYCINSAALDFIPKEKLSWTKYEKYLELFN